jgi:hypothetical protein
LGAGSPWPCCKSSVLENENDINGQLILKPCMHTQCRMVNSLDQLCAGETRAGSIIPDLTNAAQLHLHPVEVSICCWAQWVCLPVHITLGSMCLKKIPLLVRFQTRSMHSPKIYFLSPQTNNMSNPSQYNNKLEKSELEPGYTGLWGGFWFQFWKKIQSSELAIWVLDSQTKNQNQNQNRSQTKTLVYTHLIILVKRLRNRGAMNLWRKNHCCEKGLLWFFQGWVLVVMCGKWQHHITFSLVLPLLWELVFV